MKRLLSLLLVLLLALSLLAGCGSGDEGDGTGAPGDNEAAGSKDSLVIALDADVSTLHPADYSTTVESNVLSQIYDPLYRIALDGSSDPEPKLATNYEISDDGLTYTFTLREDATFHDGTPITAEDVIFSTELYVSSRYQNGKAEGLEYMKAVDEHTVMFHTSTVYAPFLESIMDIYVASSAYFEEVGAEVFASQPVGSGPYKFVGHDIGSKVELAAYEDYYLGEPDIKNVTFRVLSDDATVAVALQTGEVDFAEIKEVNYGNLQGVDSVTIEEVPTSRFGFISLNHEKYPYSETKFRQAVAYAIDRQNLIDLALDGIGTVNSNLISPLRFGYSEDQPQYGYDPEKAKELLAELGIETPYDLGPLYVAEAYSAHAQVVQNDLEAVGLITKIEILEFNAYLDKLMNGDCGVTITSMVLDGNTQEYSLALKSDYVGMANNVRFADPEIDALFDKAVETIDEAERWEIYNEIFTRVQEEAVYVTMYNGVALFAHNKDLKCHDFALEGRYYICDFSW